MKLFGVILAALLVVGMTAGTARAEEEKVVQKKMVVKCGEDGECKVTCGEGEDGKTCIIKVTEDGEEKVIKLKTAGGLIELDADGECRVMKLDGDDLLECEGDGAKKIIKIKRAGMPDDLAPETRVKLLDEKIKHLKATSQLKTDLAVAKVELSKLELAASPDAKAVEKKKQQVAGLKAKMEEKSDAYEQAVKKLLPEGMDDMFLFGLDMEDMLHDFDIDVDIDAGGHKLIKRVNVIVDEDEEDEGKD